MLIEFSVENFRSTRYRQTLSMVAAPRLQKKETNTFSPEITGERNFPRLLKVAAIYGPNASGKSTLVRAISTLSSLVKLKPSAEKVSLPVWPFKFDPELKDKPSKFEVHFVANKTRYSFYLAVSQERIVSERLTAYQKGNSLDLYTREHKFDRDVYSINEDHLVGGKSLHDAWKLLTGPQVLFISQAVANSSEEINQLRIPHKWLTDLAVVSSGMNALADVAQRLVADFPRLADTVTKLLTDVDIPVSSIKSTVIRNGTTNGDDSDALSAKSLDTESKIKRIFATTKVETRLMHESSLGSAEFDFEDESEGTKSLIGFALPWASFLGMGDFMPTQTTLVIDELDSSLHPKIIESLIKRLLAKELNTQLIFTTHDTHLMDTKLLRRDQIWLTERDATGATQLRCIHDFEGRESEDIEKRYYEGRYRSLPFINE